MANVVAYIPGANIVRAAFAFCAASDEHTYIQVQRRTTSYIMPTIVSPVAPRNRAVRIAVVRGDADIILSSRILEYFARWEQHNDEILTIRLRQLLMWG